MTMDSGFKFKKKMEFKKQDNSLNAHAQVQKMANSIKSMKIINQVLLRALVTVTQIMSHVKTVKS